MQTEFPSQTAKTISNIIKQNFFWSCWFSILFNEARTLKLKVNKNMRNNKDAANSNEIWFSEFRSIESENNYLQFKLLH